MAIGKCNKYRVEMAMVDRGRWRRLSWPVYTIQPLTRLHSLILRLCIAPSQETYSEAHPEQWVMSLTLLVSSPHTPHFSIHETLKNVCINP